MNNDISIPVYLDLGSALAAFGLIFAVYQLRKPQWELVLRIRKKWQSNLFWVFGGIGLLLVLIRVLCTQTWLNNLISPFDAFYLEVAAYLFFIASPVSLLYFSTVSKGLFKKNAAHRFYELLVWELSKTAEENINAALDVFLRNLDDICETIKEIDKKKAEYPYVNAILDITLSDSGVVKILTTKRLNALYFIFSTIEKYNITEQHIGMGIPIIVRNLFFDKDSFFYKHLHHEGLALPLNIYKIIYDSPTILSNFNLFGFQTLEYSKLLEMNLDIYFKVLTAAIRTYLKTGNIPISHINDGLRYLDDIVDDTIIEFKLKMNKESESPDHGVEWDNLLRISRFLGSEYVFIGEGTELNQKVIEREASEENIPTINAGIAISLFNFFENLSFIDENNTSYRNTLLNLTHGMIYYKSYKEGYRNPFLKRIWSTIKLNVTERYYPIVLRPYLNFLGMYLQNSKVNDIEWMRDEIERITRLLYIDIKPLLDKNTKMLEGSNMQDVLLPTRFHYHDGKFFYACTLENGDEIEIMPPPEGSLSAFKDTEG